MNTQSDFNPIPLAYWSTRIIWWLLLLGLTAVVLGTAWTYISEEPAEFSYTLTTDIEPVEEQYELLGDSGVSMHINQAEGALSISDLADYHLFASVLFPIFIIIFLALILYGVKQMINFLYDAKEGEIFTETNFERIKTIALIIIAIDPIHWVYSGFKHVLLSDLFAGSSYHLMSNLDITYLAIGFVVLAITEVFKRGYELEEEQKLTI